MQTHHKIPTIFSIYMVDVLCCALGCVILLWQVNFFEAEEQTASARDALDNLKKAKLSIDSLSSEKQTLESDLDASKKREVLVTLELNETRQDRDRLQKLALVYKNDFDNAKKAEAQLAALLDTLRQEYKELALKNDVTAADLTEKIRLGLDLSRMMKEARAKIAELDKELEQKKADALATAKKIEEQNTMLAGLDKLSQQYKDRLGVSDLRSKLLEQDLDKTRKDLLDSSKRFQDLILAQEILSKRMLMSSKELEEAKVLAAALQSKNLTLTTQAKALSLAAENRFAGVTLSGNRIIFLVDMSGSMELVEENLTDPDKWPIVCETVGKIMRSIPDLKQYQVILFSDKTRYPLGNEGQWLEYLPQHSAKATVEALKAVKPKGETNMHLAFTEAFRFRELGLDTIYFLSDGLPNSGEGLPTSGPKLTDTQVTEVLCKHLRTQLKSVWNAPQGNQPRVRINAIGFFYESPDVGAFLWALAREHNGSFVGMSRP